MQRWPSKVRSLVIIFRCTDVQNMFNGVNEYNLSEKQLSGCQSMIAWFSYVNELDTQKIMCHTYSGYIYCWYYYYCYNLAYGSFPSSLSGSCMVYMHISTKQI